MTGENYTKAGVLGPSGWPLAKQFGANTIGAIGTHGSERVLWALSDIIPGMRTSAWYSRLVDVIAGISLQPETSIVAREA